ncbi:hypothetical protein PGT21_021898 [Puccinia graminis f. sp. tritici]|uniref:Uncharacterized protein n=1 Tax=Puccinia graminis f. sp. tritici TaxID=56615 RepID=A0A5B0NAW1_PUCGR|nr:hypothetical protein PGT21_021898 [Puccinia graminis f. sp. tritici]KAA1090381.1 hypothetical protein PGTUg99_005164 [Puccinia graminis f. sp. tritici]
MTDGSLNESNEMMMIREIEAQANFRATASSRTSRTSGQGEEGQEQIEDEEIFHSFTPASFDLLVPVLKLKLDSVRPRFENLPAPASCQNRHPKFVESISLLTGWSDLICSSIILTERELSFYSKERDRSIIIPYQAISLHGISGGGDDAQLYCQLDLEEMIGGERMRSEANEQQEGQEESEEPIVLTITPEEGDRSALVQEMFRAMSYCASLHPTSLPRIEDQADKDDHHLLDALLSHDNSPEQPPADHLAAANRFQPY